jgi:hypothetical protein
MFPCSGVGTFFYTLTTPPRDENPATAIYNVPNHSAIGKTPIAKNRNIIKIRAMFGILHPKLAYCLLAG